MEYNLSPHQKVNLTTSSMSTYAFLLNIFSLHLHLITSFLTREDAKTFCAPND